MSRYQQSWGRGSFNEVDCNRYEMSPANKTCSNDATFLFSFFRPGVSILVLKRLLRPLSILYTVMKLLSLSFCCPFCLHFFGIQV